MPSLINCYFFATVVAVTTEIKVATKTLVRNWHFEREFGCFQGQEEAYSMVHCSKICSTVQCWKGTVCPKTVTILEIDENCLKIVARCVEKLANPFQQC